MDQYLKVVRHYCRHHRPRSAAEQEWSASQPTLLTTIQIAGMALDSCHKRYSHQRRLANYPLKLGTDALIGAEMEISCCRTFDELFKVVKRSVEGIDGLGELYVYDTAFRIGCRLGLKPTKVYLHRGTRAGAKALGLDIKGAQSLDIKFLPKTLQELEPHELEDVLCIYKDCLAPASEATPRARLC